MPDKTQLIPKTANSTGLGNDIKGNLEVYTQPNGKKRSLPEYEKERCRAMELPKGCL